MFQDIPDFGSVQKVSQQVCLV